MSRPAFRDSKTAFCILAWNSEAYIEKCVRSALSLECRELEVWVVDNGSEDNTAQILANIAAEDSRLRILTEKKNLGTTVSRNKVLSRISSDTDYICILDSDTVVNQEAFETLATALADEGIGVVGPTMANSAGEEQMSGRALPTVGIKLGKACPFGDFAKKAAEAERPHAPVKDGIQDVGYLISACWFFPRATLCRVGQLDEKIFYAPEDVDWCLRCHKEGLRVARCHEAHIIHEYQRIGHKKLVSKTNVEHAKGLAHYFRKHEYLLKAPKHNHEENC